MFNVLTNTVKMAHRIMGSRLGEGAVAVDATAGNGNDTLFMARLVGRTGKVYSFDIQKEALENTKELLASQGYLDKVTLIHSGHQNLKQFISEPLDAMIFNLGYLPGGDHSIITTPDSTIEAVKSGISLLKPGGLISIVVYTGHQGGEAEQAALELYLKQLDKRDCCVAKLDYLNRLRAPYLIIIEKSSGGSGIEK